MTSGGGQRGTGDDYVLFFFSTFAIPHGEGEGEGGWGQKRLFRLLEELSED